MKKHNILSIVRMWKEVKVNAKVPIVSVGWQSQKVHIRKHVIRADAYIVEYCYLKLTFCQKIHRLGCPCTFNDSCPSEGKEKAWYIYVMYN